jgi:hypothetical protein
MLIGTRHTAAVMPSYTVIMEVGGDFPAIPALSPIRVMTGFELVLTGNRWVSNATVEAPDEDTAIEVAKATAKDAVTLFQIFLASVSTPFSIYLLESRPVNVLAAPTTPGGALTSSYHLVARINARASAVVLGNVTPAIQELQGVVPFIRGAKDCEIVLYYYAKAIQEDDAAHRFLGFITVIESMLSDSQETTEKVSRRLAVLLASSREDMQKTYDDFKGFYDTRSRILHGDKIPALSQETLREVSELARLAARNYFLLRKTLSEADVRKKLDRFLNANDVSEVKRATK